MMRPAPPLARIFSVAAAVALIALGICAAFDLPGGRSIGPRGLGLVPFAMIFGLGCAVYGVLGWENRRRWRRVYRPNRGRMIGAVVLGLVTPFAVISWGPWILGGLLFIGLAETETGLAGAAFLGTCVATIFWYPASCLIVSGITRKWVRVCLFSLMYLSAYSAIILVWGNQKFTL